MRTLPLLSFLGALLAVYACGGGDDEVASRNPPVPVWRPDSPQVAMETPAGSRADSTAVNAAASPGPSAAEGGPLASRTSPAPREQQDSDRPPTGTAGSGAKTPPPAPARGDTAEQILLRAEQAYEAVRSLRADFVQDLTVPLLDETQRSRGELFHRKPDRFLMRFSDPAGDIVVADGRHLWLYYPSTDPKQVIRTSMGQVGRLDLQREFLSNPTERFNATLEGSEPVNGRPAHVLTLVPRAPSGYSRVRIWIDKEDALARRFEITEDNGNVRRVELRNLRVNVDLGDDLFQFSPPQGVQVFDQ